MKMKRSRFPAPYHFKAFDHLLDLSPRAILKPSPDPDQFWIVEKAEMPFFLAEMHVMASDYQYNVYIRKERNKII